MPWFAWLFLALSLPVVVWWYVDERRYDHTRVHVEDDLDALARALGYPTYRDNRRD